MRQPRFTYPGAFHLVSARAAAGHSVFAAAADKQMFLSILGECARHLRIRLLAWCLLDDAYQLVLENGSGRMSDFLKQVNATFVIRYRRNRGGAGSLFDGRFTSTLIQDETHLRLAILHVLQAPARLQPPQPSRSYRWSSAGEQLGAAARPLSDAAFVCDLWGGREALGRALAEETVCELPFFQTTFGRIVGRKKSAAPPLRGERRADAPGAGFVPLPAIYEDFAARHGLVAGNLPLQTQAGKRLRRDLLADLRERGGLTYREIAALAEFADLSPASLGKLYQDARRRRDAGHG